MLDEAAKKKKHLAVRLNGTSDIPHERIAPELFKKHHDVQFYDYTKYKSRVVSKKRPKNYHLTYSSTGLNHKGSNWKDAREILDNKHGHIDRPVVAMAFKVKKGHPLPTHVHDEETGKKYRVIDGDEHDHRHLDHEYHGIPHHEGVIAGLRIKGGEKNAERAGSFAVHVNEHGYAVAKKGQN